MAWPCFAGIWRRRERGRARCGNEAPFPLPPASEPYFQAYARPLGFCPALSELYGETWEFGDPESALRALRERYRLAAHQSALEDRLGVRDPDFSGDAAAPNTAFAGGCWAALVGTLARKCGWSSPPAPAQEAPLQAPAQEGGMTTGFETSFKIVFFEVASIDLTSTTVANAAAAGIDSSKVVIEEVSCEVSLSVKFDVAMTDAQLLTAIDSFCSCIRAKFQEEPLALAAARGARAEGLPLPGPALQSARGEEGGGAGVAVAAERGACAGPRGGAARRAAAPRVGFLAPYRAQMRRRLPSSRAPFR
mmetsp:Transcript_35954/g.115274  ORF Transcript_35954/g.115274 Transcript_35954/m.115274 type:complete len:306 (-) Transcript_35954:127-1044(-)